MLNKEFQHQRVMCEEVLSILNLFGGCIYLDGTLGAGGHSRKILESADCSVIGIDKDPTAIELCRDLEKQYGNKFLFINGSFGNLYQHLNSIGINKIDGILLDLGTSSMQLGTPE
jgi:Predicted S-adenosylmethionine-dependent methyltransferase involved in cell envelope biogenesis